MPSNSANEVVLQFVAVCFSVMQGGAARCSVLQYIFNCLAVFCGSQQHFQRARRRCSQVQMQWCCSGVQWVQSVAVRIAERIMQHAATRCNTLQHTATHCNTLQHSAM